MIKAKFKIDTSGLDRIERSVGPNAKLSVRNAAEALRKDVQSSWSPHSPSDPGRPPAVVSGTLDESIQIQGRDMRGRFARGENVVAAAVIVGAYYGPYLEWGTSKMEERPFMRPAVERLEGVYAEFFKGLFR